MANDVATSETVPSEAERTAADMRLTRSLLIGIFLFMAVYALYFARDFFMPVILALMLALMLTPIVRFLRRRGIPEAISATILVVVSVLSIGTAGYLLSGPVVDLVDNAPTIGRQLTERLARLRDPLDQMMDISQQVERVTDGAREPGVQKVVVAQPGIISQAAGNLLSAGTTVAITFVLSLFLLTSGTMFYEKIIQSFTRMSEKKRALRMVYDVEREISRYLLTVAIINVALGLVVALGLWAIGMPTPFVWGTAAALLNFLPYVGALMTVLLVAAIAIVSFDSLTYALLAPAFIICCNVIEGQFVTPMVVGRRLEINAVAIFVAVAFWSWLWGFVGALIAVPLLVVIKVFCDHFDSLRHVGNFLSAQHTAEEEEEEGTVANKAA
ncbi:AI-2E family transporter [Pseudaminobacter sp. NGMCC 1.201702]|uniref:AI-2E family transporter n=1 Tax=Pseudaminobacter sp. NGMCC 1.201702 TaxID=3391825 RepID=UPI0039F0D250